VLVETVGSDSRQVKVAGDATCSSFCRARCATRYRAFIQTRDHGARRPRGGNKADGEARVVAANTAPNTAASHAPVRPPPRVSDSVLTVGPHRHRGSRGSGATVADVEATIRREPHRTPGRVRNRQWMWSEVTTPPRSPDRRRRHARPRPAPRAGCRAGPPLPPRRTGRCSTPTSGSRPA